MHNPDAAFARHFFQAPSPRPVETNGLLKALRAELVAFDLETRELTMRFSPPETFRQGMGNIQGGAVAAMLDFAMVFPAFAVIPDEATVSTSTMTTSFYAPAAAETFTALGRIEKAGRRVVFASARLLAGELPVAAATSTLLISKAEQA